MRLTLDELELPLVHPFTISRGSERVARSVVVRLACRDAIGFGESAPSPRYGESIADIRAYFLTNPPIGDDPFALETLLDGVPPAARCALDIALHDLIGQTLGIPLWQLFGLDPARTPVTSFTIGIDTPEVMLAKAAAVHAHPILKIKLGFPHDVEIVEAIRARYTGTIRVDANEAWTVDEAIAKLETLAPYDVEFCEQPIPAGTPERLRYIRERSRIPIVADEDARDASDLRALVDCVDGVNVKLVKCGGLRAASAMIATARALRMRVMLGCMVESAILTTAAAHLAPLVDWADLDGPFLTAKDPFSGVTYDAGKIVLPNVPGLGVYEREAAAGFAVA